MNQSPHLWPIALNRYVAIGNYNPEFYHLWVVQEGLGGCLRGFLSPVGPLLLAGNLAFRATSSRGRVLFEVCDPLLSTLPTLSVYLQLKPRSASWAFACMKIHQRFTCMHAKMPCHMVHHGMFGWLKSDLQVRRLGDEERSDCYLTFDLVSSIEHLEPTCSGMCVNTCLVWRRGHSLAGC